MAGSTSFYRLLQYPNHKDWRKPYRGSKAFDQSCRCHGGCSRCEEGRQHFDRKRRYSADEQLKEYMTK